MTSETPPSPRRRRPAQERSRGTFDAICTAAAALIAEDGITALNTNAVARRAGVSITAVYAYFPDKWAIVQELLDRFERLRTEYLARTFEEMRSPTEWREGLLVAWRALVRYRVDVPAGVALRKAAHATPQLAAIDAAYTEHAARDFALVIRARRPDIDEDEAYRVAWATTIAAATLLDDVCAGGTIDEAKFDVASGLMISWLARYLDPETAPRRGAPGPGSPHSGPGTTGGQPQTARDR